LPAVRRIVMSGNASSRPRVICVDDEPHIVGGLALHLRRRYDVETATSGQAALELMAREPRAAVIISDMRMPGMSGDQLLAKASGLHPTTTRILLTGFSEVEAAIRAINQGQIFRFLIKPCPPPELLRVVEEAAEHHRLLVAQQDLLDRTVRGSVQMMCEVLAVTNPAAFGRATRLRQHVAALAGKLGEPEHWQVEVAAMLSELGSVTLSTETVDKLHYGFALSTAEREAVERAASTTLALLGNVPRLEAVQSILAASHQPRRPQGEGSEAERLVLRGAQLLQAARALDSLEGQGLSGAELSQGLAARTKDLEPDIGAALGQLCTERSERGGAREVALTALRVGMVVAEDVKLSTGALFVARGYEVTEGFLERVRNLRAGSVREPIKVTLAAAE
jgi:FixJ family two-component response regulator